MNIFVLFLLLVWTVIGLFALLLNALITLNDPQVLAYSLPVSCVHVGKTNSVCYTCVSRQHLYLLPFHSIEIASNQRFSFIKFEHRTGLYCDQLAQMIDVAKYGKGEILEFSHLEPIFKILNDKKGTGSRISTSSTIINPGEYQIVLFQKVANERLGDTRIETRMFSSVIYRNFLVTVKLLSLVSCVLMVIFELLKYWRQIDTEWSFLLGMLVLLAYSISFISATDFDLKTTTYAWIMGLFVFAITVEGINRKAMLLSIFVVPWINHDDKGKYSFVILVLLLFYYIYQVTRTRINTKYLVSASAFAVLLINRALVTFYLREWQSLMSFIFQSLVILSTPLIISITAFRNSPKRNKRRYEGMNAINESQSME